MVNYDFLKSIDSGLFLQMVRRGIVPVQIMDWLLIYETYIFQLKTQKKTVAITYCAEKYNFSETTIYRIIVYMNK